MTGRKGLWEQLESNTMGKWLDQGKRIFITASNKAVIGPYDNLRNYATNLWENHAAQQALIDQQGRFGLRKTDVATKTQGLSEDEITELRKTAREGYKKKILNVTVPEGQLKLLEREFVELRTSLGGVKFIERITDVYQAAQSYFSSITLESHHIIEKSMLKDMGKNDGELDDSVAPCVLVKG